jgi:hypothetical protein
MVNQKGQNHFTDDCDWFFTETKLPCLEPEFIALLSPIISLTRMSLRAAIKYANSRKAYRNSI